MISITNYDEVKSVECLEYTNLARFDVVDHRPMLFILLLGKVLSCHAYVKHEEVQITATGATVMRRHQEAMFQIGPTVHQ